MSIVLLALVATACTNDQNLVAPPSTPTALYAVCTADYAACPGVALCQPSYVADGVFHRICTVSCGDAGAGCPSDGVCGADGWCHARCATGVECPAGESCQQDPRGTSLCVPGVPGGPLPAALTACPVERELCAGQTSCVQVFVTAGNPSGLLCSRPCRFENDCAPGGVCFERSDGKEYCVAGCVRDDAGVRCPPGTGAYCIEGSCLP